MKKFAVIVGIVCYTDRNAFNQLIANHDIFILLHPEKDRMNEIALDLEQKGKKVFFIKSWKQRDTLPQHLMDSWNNKNLTIIP